MALRHVRLPRVVTGSRDGHEIPRRRPTLGVSGSGARCEKPGPTEVDPGLTHRDLNRIAYAMTRLNRRVASTIVPAAIAVRMRYCGQSRSNPIPFRKTPRTISRK